MFDVKWKQTQLQDAIKSTFQIFVLLIYRHSLLINEVYFDVFVDADNFLPFYFHIVCQTNSCLYQSLMTHLYIYILHTLSPFTCTSLIILHKTYLNIHCNTFVSTLSLIFTSQSHIILSGYDSQGTLFYLKSYFDLYRRI